MLFNSYEFLFAYLPCVLAAYWLLFRTAGPRWSILWLAAASLFFYVIGEHAYPWLIVVSILFNYGAGLAIGAAAPDRRKLVAAAAITVNLLGLFYFKYFNFAVQQFIAVGALEKAPWVVTLPIGISFYTFTQIAYIADVYAKTAAERRLPSYGLFVSYFPHLIAGPILHHKEMMPQFLAPSRRLPLNLYIGAAMFAIGLAKKVLLADPAGLIATGTFGSAAESVGFFAAWVGTLAYGLQIYFDFSGYSDMAIGLSLMLGIRLPINFNSPYKATSILQFWRRWHITLSRFLRDYLYIPLGGSRRGEGRRYINLLTTMILGGIWHGAGWTFLVWGALHGAAQAIAHAWSDLAKRGRVTRLPAWFGWALTMLFVLIAWVPFRAPNLHVTMNMWKGMAGLNGFAFPAIGPLAGLGQKLGVGIEAVQFSTLGVAQLGLISLIAVLAPNSQQIMRRYRVGLSSPGYGDLSPPTRFTLRLNWTSALLIGLMLGIAMRAIGSYSEFIYFQF